MSIQEMEMQFVSDVDSYFLVNALLAIRPENGEFIIEPEEAFLETTSLPNVTARVGKFRMALGKHNQRHTHAYPFINAPLTQETFLGEEGLQEVGVSLRYLVPTSWYQELTIQAVQGDNEDLFNATNKDTYAYLARLSNFFDLTDHFSMELGFGGASGRNDSTSENTKTTNLIGADLTFKWKPSKSRKFVWSTEYLQRQKDTLESGIFSYLEFQLADRWFTGYRYDKLGVTEDDGTDTTRHSAILSFVASEFSAVRAQYSYVDVSGAPEDHQFLVQFNMSIGAHPAHRY